MRLGHRLKQFNSPCSLLERHPLEITAIRHTSFAMAGGACSAAGHSLPRAGCRDNFFKCSKITQLKLAKVVLKFSCPLLAQNCSLFCCSSAGRTRFPHSFYWEHGEHVWSPEFLRLETRPCGHPESGKGVFSGLLKPELGGHMSLFSYGFRFPDNTRELLWNLSEM